MDKTLTLDQILEELFYTGSGQPTGDGLYPTDVKKALQELVKEAIPQTKKEEAGIERGMLNRRIGYNSAIEDITKALREKGLL